MALKNRKEMDPRYMWDLSHIYPTRDAWEKAYQEAEVLTNQIPPLAGTLGASADSLLHALDTIFAASRAMMLVYLYASLNKSGDQGDSEAQELEARAINLLVKGSTAVSFAEPEILAIPEETLAAYLQDERLATYRQYIRNVTRARSHTLDAERERMLAMLGDAAESPSNSFDMLEAVDITFPEITGENDEKVALTHGNFGVFRESKDRRVRREAFETYFGEFRKYQNTLAAMYAGSVKFDCYYAKVRNFDSALSRALFASNVPVSVYDSLVEAIHNGLPTMRRYLDLRRRVLGLEELHLYDLYAPMVEDIDFKMPYEDAQVLVKKALAPLGEEYAALLDKAFQGKWIDVYENHGKTTGAFSCGVYGVHPYVLLNYTDTLDDAFTLAHELGHAMHSYKSSETQDYVNHDYQILVAEVASTVNEVLLTKYLLSVETDSRRRAYILNHFLEGFRTTVFRQTLFAEFERRAHEMYESGTPLTAQSLSAEYHALNDLYYAGAVNDETMDIEWARIPHFYNAFYVYQYATGFCSAVAIANDILTTGDASRYLRFLTTGGSDYPLEELKIAGVDLTKPDTVESALKVFSETLDEMEKVLGK